VKNTGLLSRIRYVLLNICDKIDQYEESKIKSSFRKDEFIFTTIKHDGIYLNDIKIIDRKAKLQFAVFKILIDLHIEEFHEGKFNYYVLRHEEC
jgi:hypothetical protein